MKATGKEKGFTKDFGKKSHLGQIKNVNGCSIIRSRNNY